jgi:hypothetical protein
MLGLVPAEMKQEFSSVLFANSLKSTKKKGTPFDKDLRALSYLTKAENSVLNSEIGLPKFVISATSLCKLSHFIYLSVYLLIYLFVYLFID